MDRIGRVRVRVYTAQAELPLEDATVIVTQDSGTGKYELLSVQVTDSSGLTRPVEVATPGMAASTSPEQGGVEGFVQCGIWAEHPGYEMLRVDGVQVFPGVETIQDMELLPLEEGESSLQQREVRNIPVQNL
jgi:hypothetical protein